ncbi:MAG: hypothetical protein IT372_39355 [Polyangiaceae bacterium]|nr:hypothetical protein [Polyangiaceae bacterium]
MTYQVNGLRGADPRPHPTFRRALAALALFAAGGVIAPACAENESSLFIRACLVPEPETCVTRPDPSAAFAGRGLVDAAYYPQFTCSLLVGSQVVKRGSSDQLRTETSRIELYEAEVRVVDLGGNAVSYSDGAAVEFAVPITGFIDPGSASNPGYGIATVPLLDGGSLEGLGAAAAGAAGVADVVAMVIVRGRTLGGQEIETPEWAYPISICYGCLCENTIPDLCCADPANDECSDLDDPITTQCTGSEAYDCRLIGQTCGALVSAAP